MLKIHFKKTASEYEPECDNKIYRKYQNIFQFWEILILLLLKETELRKLDFSWLKIIFFISLIIY